MFDSIKSFLNTKVGIILTTAVVAEAMPDLSDAGHFYLQNWYMTHPLSPSWLTAIKIYDWYFLTSSFYLLILIVAFILHIKKVKTMNQILIIGAILGVSASITILWWILRGG